jgi:hypothetical protein
MERGDYPGAVRRTVTAIEAVLEWAFREELKKNSLVGGGETALEGDTHELPGAAEGMAEACEATDNRPANRDVRRNPKLRHRIVHNGLRLTHTDMGEAQKCVDTGRWLFNKIERRPDREGLRERGGLNRAFGRLAMTIRFPATLDSEGITLGPL